MLTPAAAVRFLREAWDEFRKVTWLDRRQLFASTILVLIMVFAIALYITLVDFSLSKLVRPILAGWR